jgi:hypothetical protein
MEISIVKNCVRRTESVSSNVVVANRVMANGKTEHINLYPIPNHDGYFADVDRGIVYGRQGHPIGTKHVTGRIKVGFIVDGKTKNYLRSRIIMSAALGRELSKDEEVDHVNNIVTDDRVSNLSLCDHKSNMNNSLTRTLQNNRSRRRNTSEKIEFTGAVSRSTNRNKIEKFK